MPDPKLVAYLRKVVPKYGAQPVRDKLIEEGMAEAEIDEALAIAIKRPARKLPILLCGIFGLVAVAAAAIFMILDKPKLGAPAAPPGAGGAAFSMQSTATDPAAAAPKGPFMGHYGYMLQMPPSYATQTTFKDLGNRTEVVYLFPEKTDPTNVVNEGLYGQLGIMRLEVSPLRIAQGTIGLESLRAGITKTLTSRGDTFEMRDAGVGGLPGFLVKINQPFPLVQAFIVGTKVMYVFTAGVEDQLFRNALNSLTEVSPHDRPAAP